jgi:hypothetical protein
MHEKNNGKKMPCVSRKKPYVRSVIDENQDISAIRVTLENGYQFRQLPGVSIIKVGSISVARNLMAAGEIRRKIEMPSPKPASEVPLSQ